MESIFKEKLNKHIFSHFTKKRDSLNDFVDTKIKTDSYGKPLNPINFFGHLNNKFGRLTNTSQVSITERDVTLASDFKLTNHSKKSNFQKHLDDTDQ